MVTLASPRALPSCLVLLSLAVQLCSASMAAWWVGDKRAPQILRWNATLGAITYSSCHTKDTPAFPLDPPNVLDVAQKPRNGTSLTGQGWWNSKTTAVSTSLLPTLSLCPSVASSVVLMQRNLCNSRRRFSTKPKMAPWSTPTRSAT